MKTHLSIFKAQRMITVLFDLRTGMKLHQPHRCFLAGKKPENRLQVRAPLQQGRILIDIRRRSTGMNGNHRIGPPLDRTQRKHGPFTGIVLPVIMLLPELRLQLRHFLLHGGGIKNLRHL